MVRGRDCLLDSILENWCHLDLLCSSQKKVAVEEMLTQFNDILKLVVAHMSNATNI